MYYIFKNMGSVGGTRSHGFDPYILMESKPQTLQGAKVQEEGAALREQREGLPSADGKGLTELKGCHVGLPTFRVSGML